MNAGWTFVIISSLILTGYSVSSVCGIQGANFNQTGKAKEDSKGQFDFSPFTGNVVRNVSGTEEFSMETILFPRVWESLIDAGREWSRYNISSLCSAALREYAVALQNKETWAIRIYDSTGKQGPGMVVGGLTQHGNYDECLNARHYHELEPKRRTETHRTQYCSAFFDTPVWMSQFVESLDVPYPVRLPRMTVDVCVPVTCTEHDLHTVVSEHMQTKNHNITVQGVECYRKPDITDDAVALIVIAVFSIILLLVILGTCLDGLSRLRQMEVVTGEVMQVGFQRQQSRLSRFRSSFLFHWHHIMAAENQPQNQYKPIRRRATIGGYKPSIMRRVSNSLIRRRIATDWDTKGRGGGKDLGNEGGGGNNSSSIPTEDTSGVQLRYAEKLEDGDVNKADTNTESKGHALSNGLIGQSSLCTEASYHTAANRSSSSSSTKSDKQRNSSELNTSTSDDANAKSGTNCGDKDGTKTEDVKLDIEEGNNASTETRLQDEGGIINASEASSAVASNTSENDKDKDLHQSNLSEQQTCREVGTSDDLQQSGSSSVLGNSPTAKSDELMAVKRTESVSVSKDTTTEGSSESCVKIPAVSVNSDTEHSDKEPNPDSEGLTYNERTGNAREHESPDTPIAAYGQNTRAEGSSSKDTKNVDGDQEATQNSTTVNPSLDNNDTTADNSLNSDEIFTAEIRIGEESTQIVLKKRHDDPTKQQTSPQITRSKVKPSVPPLASLTIESEDKQRAKKQCKHSHDKTSAGSNDKKTSPKSQRYQQHHDKSSSPSSPRRSPKRTFHDIDESLRRKMAASCGDEEPPPSPRTTTGSSVRSSLSSIPEETPEEVRKNLSAGNLLSINKNKTTINKTADVTRLRSRRVEEKAGEESLERPLKRQRRDLQAAESQDKPKKSRSLLADILLAFSFLQSVRKVMAEGNADHLFSLNGVRVLSISWIVLGNTVSMLYSTPAVLANGIDSLKLAQTLWFQAPMNATLAADSFFVLSGCLVTYHFLLGKSKQLEEKKGKPLVTVKAVVLFYVHRLMRILPCYYVVILIHTVLLPYMGYGPRWTGTKQGLAKCRDHWWANALLFSNFYKADDMCMPWTYYLVNDFQFYLLSPLVLYSLLYLPCLGLLLLVGLIATQVISSSLLTNEIQGHGNMLTMDAQFFSEVYVKPYCRVGTFAVGMGLGYFLYSTNRQIYFRKLPLLSGWLVAVTVMGTLVYVTHTNLREDGVPWTTVQTALFEGLSRPLWSLGLAWVIFTCSVGQGGFVDKLLSWNAFLPLCRITYGVYLLHPVLITVVLNSSRYPFYLHFGSLIYMFVANLVCAYCLAFFLITLVESPFTRLEAVLRTRFV